MVSIIDAMSDAECFGPWFEGESWNAWRAILKAAFALRMSPQELITFGELSGGRAPPTRRVRELVVCAGRRCGKDSVASLLATFAATIEQGHLGRLRPGEQAVVQCLAVDREQARIVLRYIKAFFDAIPDLGAMVTRETRFGLELDNGVSIEVTTNNFRQSRGRTVLLAILDEVAFYRSDDSATPDAEVYRAIVPSLATLPNSMLVAISSPYKKAGLLWDKYKKHFGKDGHDTLVIQAASQQLNPTLPASSVALAYETDPAAANSEMGGQFRDDIGTFVPLELIESAVDIGVLVRPPRPGVAYKGFVDAASGVGQDSFAIGIAHKDGNEIVLDLAHEIKPPFSPDGAIAECSSLLKSYGLRACTGDKYSLGFTNEGFAKAGIAYSYSEHDRSAIYVSTLPLFTAWRARIVDNRKLVTQFASLERRTSSVGRDRVDHGRDGHDDLCNAAAGALTLASGLGGPPPLNISDDALRQLRMATMRRSEFA